MDTHHRLVDMIHSICKRTTPKGQVDDDVKAAVEGALQRRGRVARAARSELLGRGLDERLAVLEVA